MTSLSQIAFALALSAVVSLSACTSSPSRTHDPDLLDDKVTTQRVSAALSNAGPDFQGIKVETRKQVVVLTGTVRSSEIRQRAEQLAKSVQRDAKLDDRIEIKR